jgi:hypothetical protein
MESQQALSLILVLYEMINTELVTLKNSNYNLTDRLKAIAHRSIIMPTFNHHAHPIMSAALWAKPCVLFDKKKRRSCDLQKGVTMEAKPLTVSR